MTLIEAAKLALEALETAFAMRVTNNQEWESIARAAIAAAKGEA
jgi:hypothetical protein